MRVLKMRLSCPNCTTEYEVPDAALAKGSRKLRCERCGAQWRWVAEGVTAPQAAWAPPEPPVFPTVPVAYTPMPLAEYEPPPAYVPLPVAPEPLPAYVPELPQPEYAPVVSRAVDTEATMRWTPEVAAERLAALPMAEPRRFGQPADDEALAEIKQAVVQEQSWQPEIEAPEEAPLPNFLTAERGNEALGLPEPSPEPGQDRFAELVYAARNKAIEYEPEAPAYRPPVRTSNAPLFVVLLLAFIVACVLVEHRNISHFVPASAKFFAILGLK